MTYEALCQLPITHATFVRHYRKYSSWIGKNHSSVQSVPSEENIYEYGGSKGNTPHILNLEVDGDTLHNPAGCWYRHGKEGWGKDLRPKETIHDYHSLLAFGKSRVLFPVRIQTYIRHIYSWIRVGQQIYINIGRDWLLSENETHIYS